MAKDVPIWLADVSVRRRGRIEVIEIRGSLLIDGRPPSV